MTTEKEFWEFAGRYFRTVVSIQNIIDELKVSGGLSKDVRAIKAMKRVENVMKEFDEQKPADPINEGCVGCCRVQCDTELIERLSTEIHRDKTIKEYKETIQLERIDRAAEKDMINRKYSEDLRKKNIILEELKDRNTEDLHELYDLYEEELSRFKHVISARDLTIKSLTTMCQSSGTERNRLTKELRSAKSDYEIMRTNHYNTIAKLREDIRGLEVELAEKQEIIDKITSLRVDEVEALYCLEVELSARKEDSAVLMKVVDIVKNDKQTCCHTLNMISVLLTDYLDAPEEPPEVNTTMFEVEYPVDGSRTIHLQKMRIAEQKQTIEKLKSDSDVLMKVVKAIGVWHCCMIPTSLTGCTDLIKILDNIVEDYADGSPKTPIDDLYKVTVSYAFLEMP